MFFRRLAPWLLICLLAAACEGRPRADQLVTIKRTWPVIGAPFSVQIFGAEKAKAEAALRDAQTEIRRMEELANPYAPDSDLSRINDAAGKQPVTISAEVAAVLALAEKISASSDGAFDVTFGGVGRLWNLKDANAPLPTDAQIAAALRLVGYRHLHLDAAAHTAFLDQPGMRVGVAALAPGWLADAVMRIFRRHGVNNAIVDASGDMLVIGSKNGEPWRIGIQHPRLPEGRNYAVLEIYGDLAVATSGDYERYVIKNGVRYCHIFDPHTGRPAALCQSATIVGPNAALADALATTVFVLGPEKGLAMLAQYFPQCDALVIDAAGHEHTSPQFIARTKMRRLAN